MSPPLFGTIWIHSRDLQWGEATGSFLYLHRFSLVYAVLWRSCFTSRKPSALSRQDNQSQPSSVLRENFDHTPPIHGAQCRRGDKWVTEFAIWTFRSVCHGFIRGGGRSNSNIFRCRSFIGDDWNALHLNLNLRESPTLGWWEVHRDTCDRNIYNNIPHRGSNQTSPSNDQLTDLGPQLASRKKYIAPRRRGSVHPIDSESHYPPASTVRPGAAPNNFIPAHQLILEWLIPG